MPTEMDVLVEADTDQEPVQPSASPPSDERAGAAAAAPLPAREAAMATAAATVTTAVLVAPSKGATEVPDEADIRVTVMAPGDAHEYTPQV